MNPRELKQWQADLGLSEAAMAAYLGVPVPTYRKWTNGTRKPDAAPMRLFAILQLVQLQAPEMHANLIDLAQGSAPAPESASAKPKRSGKGKVAPSPENASQADSASPEPQDPEALTIPKWLMGSGV